MVSRHAAECGLRMQIVAAQAQAPRRLRHVPNAQLCRGSTLAAGDTPRLTQSCCKALFGRHLPSSCCLTDLPVLGFDRFVPDRLALPGLRRSERVFGQGQRCSLGCLGRNRYERPCVAQTGGNFSFDQSATMGNLRPTCVLPDPALLRELLDLRDHTCSVHESLRPGQGA